MVAQYCPYVSGPVLVKVNLRDKTTGGSPTNVGWRTLGYTVGGVQVEEQILTQPVYTDSYCGSQGAPADRQFMGKTLKVSLSLSVYNMATIKKMQETYAAYGWQNGISDTVDSATGVLPGSLVGMGAMMGDGNRSMQVLLIGEADLAAEAAAVAGGATAGTTPLIANNLNLPNCWYDGPVKFPIGSPNTIFDLDLSVTPFTTNSALSGPTGETILWIENNTNLITDMNSYVRGTPN